MKNIAFLFLVFFPILVFSQPYGLPKTEDLPTEFQDIFQKADNCITNPDETCLPFFKQSIHEASQSKSPYQSTLYCRLAWFYYLTGDIEPMLTELHKGLAIARKKKEWYNRGVLANFMGIAHSYITNNIDSVLEYFIEAQNCYIELNDSVNLAKSHNNIASVYVDIIDNQAASNHYHKALLYLTDSSNPELNATIRYNLGENYLRLKNTDSAFYWAFATKKYIEQYFPNKNTAVAYHSDMLFANIFKDKEQWDSAGYYAELALQGTILNDDSFSMADAYAIKGVVALQQSKYKEAISYALAGIEIFERMNYDKGISRINHILAESYYHLSDYKNAAFYFRNQLKLWDTTVTEKQIYAVKEINAKYETEKKERQLAEQKLIIQKKNANIQLGILSIGVLISGLFFFFFQYKRNQKRKLILLEQENENAVLKAIMNGEERERNRISKDLHDGVAAVLGAAKMSLQSIPFLKEEKKEEQIQKVTQLINSTHTDIRRIAHNLLPIVLEKEGFIAALNEFVADFNGMGILKITIDNQLANDLHLSINIELMLFRIVQELVNNIMKHSQASHALIGLEKTKDELKIKVSDNGIGYREGSESQGLYSIKERLQSIGGQFQIKRNEQKGSAATLVINLA